MANKRDAESLLAAAAQGDCETLRTLLASGVAVDDSNEYDHTALMEAASNGQTAALKLLLDAGANPRAQNSLALDFAVRLGNADCVRLLLANGADPNCSEPSGDDDSNDAFNDPPPLYEALLRGNREMVDALLDAGAQCDTVVNGAGMISAAIHSKNSKLIELMFARGADTTGALRAAIEVGDEVVVDRLLQHGVDFEDADDFGKSPLALAAYYGQLATIRKLLAAGANLESADEFGRTPLGDAISEGKVEAVKLLLQAGAKLTDDRNGSMLEDAIANENAKIMKVLLDAGADPNKGSRGNPPPLFRAVESGKASIVNALLDSKAQVDVRIGKKRMGAGETKVDPESTPLMFAAKKGKEKIVALLLAAGADPAAIDSKGRTAADYAAKAGRNKIVEILQAAGSALTVDDRTRHTAILLRAIEESDAQAALAALSDGANPNYQTQDGTALLTLAVRNGLTEVVEALLKAGAEVNSTSQRNESPLRAAALRENAEIVRLLIQAGADVRRVWSQESIDANARNTVYFSFETALHDAAVYGNADTLELLLAAGSDIDAIGPSGLTPVLAAVNHRRMDSVKRLLEGGAKVRAEDEIWLAPYRFAQAAQSPEFGKLADEIAAACNVTAEPLPNIPGVQCFKLSLEGANDDRPPPADAVEAGRRWGQDFVREYSQLDCKASAIVDKFAARALALGFSILDIGKPLGCGPMVQYLALLPTADKFQAMVAFGVRGNDQELRTADIVEWFRTLDAEIPFRLRGVRFDTVDIEFTAPIPDPGALAKRINEICHDIAGGDADGEAKIAAHLRQSNRVHFWWD